MRASQRMPPIRMQAVPGKRLKPVSALVYLTDRLMRRLIVRPEAEADITKSAIWYASREPELGLEPCGHPNTQLRSPFTIPGFLSFVRVQKFVAFWSKSFRIAFSILSIMIC